MRFRILGPLQIGADLDERAITAGRDRVVVSMLLLHPGRVVSVDELLDAVWPDGPPATARNQLQACVSRLRRALPAGAIITDPAGYGIRVGDDDLDALRFTHLTAEARAQAEVAPDDARRRFRTALQLWRGPALAGIDAVAVRQGAAVLDEQRATAIEDWVDLELSGGRERDLIAELVGLVERFPFRERLRGQLMTALYRAGRKAEALAEYRQVCAVLGDQLGMEPGPQLQDLYRRMAADAVAASGDRPTVDAVRCLPRAVGDFTGRGGIVTALCAAIDSAPPGPVIEVIDGMAGIGKTALAVHLAGLVGDRYPDAHLFVDLHGHSDRSPTEPAAALVTLLRQLGLTPDRIPADLDERMALWRAELAKRRALVVLDNATGSAQVRPLLPGSNGCLVLVTSRRRLTGIDGVRPTSIPVLTETEGVDLLSRIVGARVAAEPDAALEVVRRCGALPLAIRLAGARLAHRPWWHVSDLVRRLDEAVLPALAAEDRTVASAFALSYGQLDPAAQRLFVLLGIHPDPRFDALSVAALADLELSAAQDLLDVFVDLHLVEEPGPGLYRLHDLMREYAAILAEADRAGDLPAAMERLVTHYIDASLLLTRAADPTNPWSPAKAGRPDLIAAVTDSARWHETHRTGFIRMIDAAARRGQLRPAWRLAKAAARFFFTRGYFDDLVETQVRALAAAQAGGDREGIAGCYYNLASARMVHGRLEESMTLLRQALDLYVGLGDIANASKVRGNLGGLLCMVARFDEAWEVALEGVNDVWRSGVSYGWQGLTAAGEAAMSQGRYEDALRCHRLYWWVSTFNRNPHGPAVALGCLGEVRLRTGQPRLAASLLRASIERRKAVNYRAGSIGVLTWLAIAYRMLGDLAAAVDQHRHALQVMEELNESRWESVVCNDYAATLLRTGDREAALALHRRAMRAAEQAQIPYEHATALAGIAACLVDDDPATARAHWQQARERFTRMGIPERFDVERRLAELDRGADQLQDASSEGTMVS